MINFYVKFIFKHPGYNKIAFNNDIALLKLAKPVTFTNKIKPACLSDVDLAQPTSDAYITGWVFIYFFYVLIAFFYKIKCFFYI